MKKVRFETSGAIALHQRLGHKLASEQLKPVKLEGWLVGKHICVQKPSEPEQGYCLSLYPWGDRLTAEFLDKADAVACAKELDALNIPWEEMRALDPASADYADHLVRARFVIANYEVEGLTMRWEI